MYTLQSQFKRNLRSVCLSLKDQASWEGRFQRGKQQAHGEGACVQGDHTVDCQGDGEGSWAWATTSAAPMGLPVLTA